MKTLVTLLLALNAFLVVQFHGIQHFHHAIQHFHYAIQHLHAIQATPAFEVASVRPTPPSKEHGMSLSMRLDESQMRIVALPLRDIVATAHRLLPVQVIGPDWMNTTQFDISAKLPPGAKARQIPEMLQALLADRFGLTFHREKKEMAVYALVIGKAPLTLRAHQPEPDAPPTPETLTWALVGSPAGVSNDRGNGSSYSFANGRFEGRKLSIAALATELARYSARPIIDMTQLDGTFDMNFTVSPDAYQQLLMRAAYNSGMQIPPQMLEQLDNADVNSLPEAVEQMGLKLETRRMPVDVLTIDQIRKTPTDN